MGIHEVLPATTDLQRRLDREIYGLHTATSPELPLAIDTGGLLPLQD
jgi:hypothetical protein